MLYRLRPPSDLTWCDAPARATLELAERQPEGFLDRLPWLPTESRVFSTGLLRIALRHGVLTATGIVLDAGYTVDLGRADELRLSQQTVDESQAAVRTNSGELLERLIPGWTETGRELDNQVRDSTGNAIREAEQDLAEVLAAPERPELANHWVGLGGQLTG